MSPPFLFVAFHIKDEVAAGMLQYSSKPIPTSITILDPPLAKEAIRINKAILGI